MSEEEIKKQAQEFFEKYLKIDWEIKCTACGADNCKCNETCIKCGCQL